MQTADYFLGIDGEARVPWYFPRPGDYATRLERAGFRVWIASLIPRPMPLLGDTVGGQETFALNFFQGFSDEVLKRTAINDELPWVFALQFAPSRQRVLLPLLGGGDCDVAERHMSGFATLQIDGAGQSLMAV